MKRCIDVHAHILPDCFIEAVRSGNIEDVRFENRGSGKEVLIFGASPHPFNGLFHDQNAQIEWMDRNGITDQFVSIGPRLFFYDRPLEFAVPFCRMCNDEILDRSRKSNGRIHPVGGVPLQDVSTAIDEIRYLKDHGVSVVQIGATVNDLNLDDESFIPFYKAVSDAGIILLIHPLIENSNIRTKRHHLGNVVGNPFQTTAAAYNLIAGGIFDKVPGLQVLLVHGGGFVPYQLGRLDHAYEVRPRAEFLCMHEPSWYVNRNLLFDSLLFDRTMIEMLLAIADPLRVMFGTDYPYDMADTDSFLTLGNDDAIEMISYRNSERILLSAAER